LARNTRTKSKFSIFTAVKGLKTILASFFLMIYFISFGHSIIPHHHHSKFETDCQYTKSKSADCYHTEGAQEHFAHQDHEDEGLLDFLSCLLSTMDNEASCHIPFVTSPFKLKRESVQVDLIADFNLSFSTFVPVETFPNVQIPIQLFCKELSGFTKVATLRGPPVFV
jgi:hypothetical protein